MTINFAKKSDYMNTKQKADLIKSAIKAREFAFSPITNVNVGAAVLTSGGKIYSGCNIQSVISGLGTCAERCAIYCAVANGSYNYKAIAISFDSKKTVWPCGACLQTIHEFSEINDIDTKILIVNNDGKVIGQSSIRKLLTKGYGPKESGKDIKRYKNM